MKIFRISSILFLLMAACSGVLLFRTSQAVQQKESDLREVRTRLAQEQETLRVLHVEWDYLNRPQRIEELAASQLGMELPSTKELIRTAADIPEPIIVNTNPDFYEEDGAPVGVQMVSTAAPVKVAPKAAPIPKKETVAPDAAEKMTFYQLIQQVDAKGGGQ